MYVQMTSLPCTCELCKHFIETDNDKYLLVHLMLLTHVRIFSKTASESDTFGIVLMYGKQQESRKSFITVQEIHLPERV